MIGDQKPEWLKIRPPKEKFSYVKETVRRYNLHTVCEEAKCPNLSECWSGGTSTFMVMGDTCTRGCRFCAVKTFFKGQPLDPEEPMNVARAVQEWGLDYIVITSVDRDDLPDQGSEHFARVIQEVRRLNPKTIVEVLIPDFRGDEACVRRIVDARPHVIAHNVETCRELQKRVRDPRANFDQSLRTLILAKQMDPSIFTKSGIMVGLGETREQIERTMDEVLSIGVQLFTVGQYLQPTKGHLKVERFVQPKEFVELKEVGERKGFLYVAAGPFVRSSYKAGELFLKNVIGKHGGGIGASAAGASVPASVSL